MRRSTMRPANNRRSYSPDVLSKKAARLRRVATEPWGSPAELQSIVRNLLLVDVSLRKQLRLLLLGMMRVYIPHAQLTDAQIVGALRGNVGPMLVMDRAAQFVASMTDCMRGIKRTKVRG